MNILKSILAIFVGFILVVVISVGTDLVLEKSGLMLMPFHLNSSTFILFVIFYRTLYSTIGSFVTAHLAPGKPMLHAMIGGVIGFLLSIVGTIAMWDTPPHWYPITLIITALPSAWLGAQLWLNKSKNR